MWVPTAAQNLFKNHLRGAWDAFPCLVRPTMAGGLKRVPYDVLCRCKGSHRAAIGYGPRIVAYRNRQLH
jgi:hypothetical protein